MSKKTTKKAPDKVVEAEESPENESPAPAPTPIKTDKGPNTPQKGTVEARLDDEIAVYTAKLRSSPHRSEGQRRMEAVLSVLQRVKGGN